jgi:sarcosine oxidase subunit beta
VAVSDVLVIGAGVTGASAAYHLSALGASVTVLDRDVVAAGMSSRSSALVRMHYTFPPEVDLAVRSDAMFGAWPELTGRPCPVRRTGFVRIVAPGEEAALRANVAMQREHGVTTEVVDAQALRSIDPALEVSDLSCAAWEERGGYGDGAVVAGDLLAAARRLGARYRPHTPARALLRCGDRVTGVQTADGPQHAATVLVATGVWSAPLLATAGIGLPIETELHHVALLASPPSGTPRVACIDSTTQSYFRPEAGGTMTLVGGFTGARGTDPDRLPRIPPAAELAALAGAAARRVPALADAGISSGISGVYDMTPDSRPLLGGLPGLAGLVVAAGFSGMGFKISPAVGEALAELIVHGRARHADLDAFRPSRFADGQPVTAPHPYADD